MNLTHWLRREATGLGATTLDLAAAEARQGHGVRLQEPQGAVPVYESFVGPPDVHCIHSQLSPTVYHDHVPKIMWMHGEPLGSVGNGVSMRAIVDLAPQMDAFICMRAEEQPVWNAIRRTYVVPKGVDCQRYHPLDPAPPTFEGAPAVLYYENWRGTRNPLLLCLAMQEVHRILPEARLHLYNCPGGKMADTFISLINHCRWYTFCQTIKGPEPDANVLLNRADIVVSCLAPLYARGVEAFAAGKAFIGPGYKEHDYPYVCELEVFSIAEAILKCWAEYGRINFRQWALDHHNIEETVKASTAVYARYC